jgi:DNA-binding phage protein
MPKLLNESDVLRLLREEVDRAGGQSAWARRSGIDRVHLNKVMNGERPLSPSIVKALNLKGMFIYERKTAARRSRPDC